MHRLLFPLLVLAAWCGPGLAFGDEEYAKLPSPVRQHAEEIRKVCRDNDPDWKPGSAMSGILEVTMDGQQAFVVDNKDLCAPIESAGVNCSNRGCDLKIWKRQVRDWKLVLDEHAYSRYVSVTPQGGLAALIIAVQARHPQCHPPSGKEYSSAETCDILGRYKQGRWHWEKLN
ncbi:MAG TPA: hypothetical protein VNR51_04145 [Hyphomicrobium sp.]|nr:hypothetical protein [Hyphomicrobium sp.]